MASGAHLYIKIESEKGQMVMDDGPRFPCYPFPEM